MKVLLFGASGMVGTGVLRECLLADDVTVVRSVGRTPLTTQHAKLVETIRSDLYDYASIEAELTGYDACFFCLGVSSFGLQESAYSRLTYDLTLAAATTLARLNPQMTFIYVSGSGTDSTEQGKRMWARVKGRTENALRRLSFRSVYLFRPGMIVALHGARSKVALYNAIYTVVRPLIPLLKRMLGDSLVTTESVGRAMLACVRTQPAQHVVEPRDITALGR
ncbi:epimerase [soil metagenome]